MATRKITKAPAPDVISSRKATQLCKEWCDLNDERLELERIARDKKKIQDAIEVQLAPFIDANKEGPARLVELSKYVAKIELRDGTLFYKGELEKIWGKAAFDAKIAMLPKTDKVVIYRK